MYKCKSCGHCPTRWGGWGHYFCPGSYRVLKGFTYKGEPKKEKPTVHRWKTEKNGHGGYWYGSSWKKNWKHYTKRKHRAWQRDMLRHERYEEFHNQSYKDAEDSWSWD